MNKTSLKGVAQQSRRGGCLAPLNARQRRGLNLEVTALRQLVANGMPLLIGQVRWSPGVDWLTVLDSTRGPRAQGTGGHRPRGRGKHHGYEAGAAVLVADRTFRQPTGPAVAGLH